MCVFLCVCVCEANSHACIPSEIKETMSEAHSEAHTHTGTQVLNHSSRVTQLRDTPVVQLLITTIAFEHFLV